MRQVMFDLIGKRCTGPSLIVLLSLVLFGCKGTRVTPDQVLATIGRVENELNWLDYRLNLEHWKVLNGQPSDSLEFFQALHLSYFRQADNLSLLRSNRTLIKSDEIATRKYDLLIGHLIKGYVESSPSVVELRDSIFSVNRTTPLQIGTEILSRDQLDRILAFSSDRTRRELAFRAKQTGGDSQAGMMARLIRLRNQEAAKLGYNDYFAMTFPTDGLSLAEYRKLLDDMEEATAAPYQAILDRIGGGRVEPWDLIHALSADLRGLYERPTIDSQWSAIQNSFSDLGFDLNKLPIYQQLSASPDDPPGVIALTINSPYDQRLIGNLGPGIRLTRQITRSIAGLIHSLRISETEPIFVDRIHGAWTEGVAELFGSMVKDSAWLATYLNLAPPVIKPITRAQRELDLVRLRMLLLKLNFEYEAYRSRKSDFNRLYWDLCDRIMRLARHDDIAPWASDMELVANPISSQNHLLGKIIAAQTKAYLLQVNGSVVGNPETRSFVSQNYMRFGARYPWTELLERGTGAELNYEFLVQALVGE